MQQTVATRKNPLLPVTTSVVYPFGKNKRMAPRQILFEYLFFFRLQAFKELYYAFSAILSHMNEPATKETDNQCNKKTTNLRE